MNILECNNLNKSYRKGLPVLSNLNLQIPEGKIVGLLGPNGCGKSTLMKLISGILNPDSGTITVDGTSERDNINSVISYLPERTYFDSKMVVSDIINYFSDFYQDFDPIRAYKLLSDLLIDPKAKLKTLSKGTKEKVQLILVMSRKAKLYLLDEPIAGVDPAAREYILNTIIGNYNQNASIIITTHLIADIESVLDEYVFMGFGGCIIRSGNAEETRIETGKTIDEVFREVVRC